MRVARPHLWIAGVSALAVLTVAVVDVDRTSPGPLTSVHGELEELAGGRSCRECHGGWTTSMTEACLDCHALVAEHVEGGLGLHGMLARPERCAQCHSEHHGASFAIVNRQSFAQAGVPDPGDFDHALVGFPMGGRHLELECAECHEHADAGVLPAGSHRYMGLDRDCAACHDDPHEGRLTGRACADCHGQQSFDALHSAGHERVLPLLGGHADLDCRTCHAEGGPRALEALAGPRGAPRGLPDRGCLDCHDSPHADGFLEAVGRRTGRSHPAETCARCHEPDHEGFRDDRLDVGPALHACSGFGLDAPHDGLDCAACHDPDGATFAERYPGRGADACARCHDDPHGGQFDGGPFAGGCLACHDRRAFEPVPFGVEQHALAALALDGAHADADCHACHVDPPAEEPRAFRGTPDRCAACHADAHRGAFDPHAEELAGADHGACAACHRPTRFADRPAGGFEHERWTGYALAGAHDQAACEACHARAASPDANGRTFGFVADRYGAVEGCATCHRDPHEGRFDARGLPPRLAGRTGCARCHDESSFRALPRGFDHGRWTGWELDGSHAEAACSACHAPLRRPDAVGRTWGRVAGAACADCHADPHAGQFAAEGAPADCARCHASASPWNELAFDHDRDARFVLGDAHAGLACAACHDAVAAGDFEVTRYRPLPTRCVDCHGVHEDALRKRRGR